MRASISVRNVFGRNWQQNQFMAANSKSVWFYLTGNLDVTPGCVLSLPDVIKSPAQRTFSAIGFPFLFSLSHGHQMAAAALGSLASHHLPKVEWRWGWYIKILPLWGSIILTEMGISQPTPLASLWPEWLRHSHLTQHFQRENMMA